MTTTTKEITEMVALLPETEQNLAYEFVKRMVLAWDPDFTKLTPNEKKELERSLNSEYVDIDNIDWN